MLETFDMSTNMIFQMVISVGAMIVALISGFLISWFAKQQMSQEEWSIFFRENFNLLIGIPQASVIAFGTVLYFNISTDAALTITFFGFEFSGPSVPAIIWMVLFLAITGAIHLFSKYKNK